VDVHRLDRAQARQIAVRAQLLDRPRPTDLVEVVRQLTLLQIDPTAAIAPSAYLVGWSRLGPSYQPSRLKQALERDRMLVEFNAMVLPMTDMGLLLAGANLAQSARLHESGCVRMSRFVAASLRCSASRALRSRDIRTRA